MLPIYYLYEPGEYTTPKKDTIPAVDEQQYYQA